MIFKRPTNTRKPAEREELLDVKLRTGQVRAARAQMAVRVFIGVLVLAALWLGGWKGGGYLLDRYVYKSSYFAIERIDVRTDGVLSAETIRKWAGVSRGENLLALDLMRVKRGLVSQPWVRWVAVERRLPRTLLLRVSEREPVAQTMVMQPKPNGDFERITYLLDADGYTMRPLDPQLLAGQPMSIDYLPTLLDVRVSEIQPGRQTESPKIRAALDLLSEFERSPMFGLVELQRISISPPEVLQAATSQGAEITFSLDNFDQQFRRWRSIYDMYINSGRAVASLDLSLANNLPVRWVAANTLQPVTPRPVRQRNRR